MKSALILFLIASALFLIGCGRTPDDPGSGNTATGGKANENSVPESAVVTGPERVEILSEGNVRLVGTYYGQSKPDSPAILFLHQWYSDRSSFDEFAREMQKEGFASLAIDGRGFGESTKRTDGSTVEVSSSADAFRAMLADVDKALTYLAEQKNVNASRIGVVGASYGSSQAVNYAAGNQRVKAIALLSPGLNYFDTMPTEGAADKYGERPIFAVSARDDEDSKIAVETFEDRKGAMEHNVFKIYDGKAHGTDLFKSGSSLSADLKDFLKKNI